MRKIIGYLSEEDHERFLRSYCRGVVAMNGHPGLSFEDAAKVVEKDQRLFGELRKKYDVEPYEVVDFALFDGAILEVDE